MSLTTISEAFHAIAHKYEKLTTTVPHMTHVQVAEVVVRLPIMPVLKQKIKIEKRETENPTEKDTATNQTRDQPTAITRGQAESSTSQEISVVSDDKQPMPSTSCAPSTSSVEVQLEENPDVMKESTGRKEDESKSGERSEIFNRYALTGRG